MTPASQLKPELITLTQYEALPEAKRAEVFDSIVCKKTGPSHIHQALSMQLSNIIFNYIKNKKGQCSVFTAPFDVKLSDTPLTIVQPDIMVVCDKNKLDEKRCNGAPDFIIEIASPGNSSDDYIRKLYYYKKYGVREYWIVDSKRKIITVNFFENNIVSVQYPFDSVIKVNIYDDLFIDFSEISDVLSL